MIGAPPNLIGSRGPYTVCEFDGHRARPLVNLPSYESWQLATYQRDMAALNNAEWEEVSRAYVLVDAVGFVVSGPFVGIDTRIGLADWWPLVRVRRLVRRFDRKCGRTSRGRK